MTRFSVPERQGRGLDSKEDTCRAFQQSKFGWMIYLNSPAEDQGKSNTKKKLSREKISKLRENAELETSKKSKDVIRERIWRRQISAQV